MWSSLNPSAAGKQGCQHKDDLILPAVLLHLDCRGRAPSPTIWSYPTSSRSSLEHMWKQEPSQSFFNFGMWRLQPKNELAKRNLLRLEKIQTVSNQSSHRMRSTPLSLIRHNAGETHKGFQNESWPRFQGQFGQHFPWGWWDNTISHACRETF